MKPKSQSKNKADWGSRPDPGSFSSELGKPPQLPRNEMERLVASVWERLLGLQEIGIDENFFDLGGHSSLLIQAASQLQEILEQKIPLIDMFRNPTIRSLAKHLSQVKDGRP